MKQIFPSISESRSKERIFVGPNIKEAVNTSTFYDILNKVEGSTCKAFTAVTMKSSET
jgi:hypothetical protein